MESRSVEQHLGFSKDNDRNDLSAYVALDYTQNPEVSQSAGDGWLPSIMLTNVGGGTCGRN